MEEMKPLHKAFIVPGTLKKKHSLLYMASRPLAVRLQHS